MNVIDYISYYGKHTFEEKAFNEVDNVIFSMLSYVDYNGIVPKNKNEITIEEAHRLFKQKDYDDKNIMLSIKQAIKVLESASGSNRFRNITMSNYMYIGNEESQFSAVTFKITKDLYYISFEGTDALLSGWEEDCKMAYKFPVAAHVLAKEYLNKVFTLRRGKVIVGGHSKGGNLALVASMYCNRFVRKKIINVYSNDGQGLRETQLNSKQYSLIKDRYIHIIPNYSIVGLLLRHDDNYIVVKSDRKGFYAHDAFSWQVSYDHLEKELLSRFSKVFDDGFSKWLDNYDDEQRRKFVNEVFKLFYENGFETVTEVRSKLKNITTVVKSSKTMDPVVKEMFKELIKIVGKTNLEYPWF